MGSSQTGGIDCTPCFCLGLAIPSYLALSSAFVPIIAQGPKRLLFNERGTEKEVGLRFDDWDKLPVATSKALSHLY